MAAIKRIHGYTLTLMFLWTALAAASLWWGVSQHHHEASTVARTEAAAYFNKDNAIRLWAASHGGVYVPADEHTLPSPYLAHMADRDISKPSGEQLTLMSPAYMIRQMNEDFSALYGVSSHITSLNPLRPENVPDHWEKKALLAFAQGETEVVEMIEKDGKSYLRLMRPLENRDECLKCHAEYNEGEINGGISVSLPMEHIEKYFTAHDYVMTTGYVLLWIMGMGGLLYAQQKIAQKVRERDIAEILSAESENKYKMIVENQSDLVVKFDNQNRLLYVSPSYLKTFGRNAEELLGNEFMPLVHEDDREKIKESLKGVFFPPYTTQHDERAMTLDGWRWFSWSVRGIPDNKGGVKEIIGVGRDITHRKEIENSLKQSEEKFRTVSDFTYAWEYWMDTEGNLMYVSPSCKRISGYEPEDFLKNKKLFESIILPDDRQKFKEHIEKELDSVDVCTRTFRIITMSGETRWISHICQPVYNAAGECVGRRASNHDITERKQVEEEREQLIQKLKEALDKVKVLSGFLPICSSCKMIRDDKGYWNQIESYIRDHSEAQFSHSICPDCARKLYPDIDLYDADGKVKKSGPDDDK
ncbi:MAG: PAS domain S-box protein [Proteobacteria bacterium]|nr:PAS domain S-box protein [Pseudomonadota bacterium]MBU1710003.1 PAS domain S-box protein [Pseudomonadota bacterium]